LIEYIEAKRIEVLCLGQPDPPYQNTPTLKKIVEKYFQNGRRIPGTILEYKMSKQHTLDPDST